MAENSPTFQRWGRECRGAQVPKGRLKPCAIRQPSLRDLSDHGRWFPTLKRWAIIECPSGTKTCPGLAYFVGANPSGIGHSCPPVRALVYFGVGFGVDRRTKADKNVRAPITRANNVGKM